MRVIWNIFIMYLIGMVVWLSATFDFLDKEQPEYTIVEDNAVETIITIKRGDDLTLLNVNRYEEGGGLWEVTYDGENEPVTRRVD